MWNEDDDFGSFLWHLLRWIGTVCLIILVISLTVFCVKQMFPESSEGGVTIERSTY